MTTQQLNTMLAALRIDLGITAHAYDGRLEGYLRSAIGQIETEGITLDFNRIDDCQLVIMYAAWMWRKRDFGDTAGMPRMIRYALNNRLFEEKVTANG